MRGKGDRPSEDTRSGGQIPLHLFDAPAFELLLLPLKFRQPSIGRCDDLEQLCDRMLMLCELGMGDSVDSII
ncbi:hypothetical protein CHI12_01885 [Terribacillus saccharophilus]|uniref:Uncharacterized protein n=1 Tax=Terribacillus saccharophilus TaxID=361277 RepID=A0A268HGU9_9BACI|nr:hypothetical protein CHI12_01885 [Terribacillus saccharophilus]